MAGVIFQRGQLGPYYKAKPLKNVPLKRKIVGNVLAYFSGICMLYNIGLLITSMAYLTPNKSDPKDEIKEVVEFLLLALSHSVNITVSSVFLLITADAYEECCSTQKVTCRTPKKQLLNHSIGLAIVCGIELLFPIFADIHLLIKIANIAGFVATNSLTLGRIYFAEKCCQCKKCLGLKDVKLSYNGVTVSVSEEENITSLNLRSWLNISSSNENRLAVQIKHGEVIYEFNAPHQNPEIQLHEGEYVVREFAFNLVPQQNVPNNKTTTAPSDIPSHDEAPKCTIMTID